MATAQNVIDRARQLINDVASSFVSGLRWSDAELLQWLTDGQREIVKLKPEANAVTDAFTVVDTMPRQRLDPAIAYRLIRVEANGTGVVAEATPAQILGVHIDSDVVGSDSFTLTGFTVPEGTELVIVHLSARGSDAIDTPVTSIDLDGIDAGTALYQRNVTGSGTGSVHSTLAMIDLRGETLTASELNVDWTGVGGEKTYAFTLVFVAGMSEDTLEFETGYVDVDAAGDLTLPELTCQAGDIVAVFGTHTSGANSPAYTDGASAYTQDDPAVVFYNSDHRQQAGYLLQDDESEVVESDFGFRTGFAMVIRGA